MKNIPVSAMCVIFLVVFSTGKAISDDHKTDGEIVGLLMAGDKSEIALAQQAESKQISSNVMAYASMLEREHKDDLDKLQALSLKAGIQPPAMAGTVLRAKGIKNLAMLAPLNGNDYDKAYLTAMVKDHTEDLELIDTDLMKDVQNPDLRAQLLETRSHMAMHLEKAKQLQS